MKTENEVSHYSVDAEFERQVHNWFTYHAPHGDQADRYQILRDEARELAFLICKIVPPGAEMKVALTWSEIRVACTIGCLRRATSIKEKMNDRAGLSNDWTADIEGAAGEIAFCKGMNIYWPATNKTFSIPDVGVFEIKTSSKIKELPVPLNAKNDSKYVLIFGQIPNFEICGWIYGWEAKRFPEKTVRYYPCHWVPADALTQF